MPRRWLSFRGHHKEPKDAVVVIDDHFDFDFPRSSAFASPTSPACITPVMFGTQNRSKRIKRSSSRPQTSDGPRPAVDRRLQLTKVDDSWIGVAFGSPTHPPAFCPSPAENDASTSSNHAFRLEGPLPTAPQPTSRYKKFGSIFKLRSTCAGLPISAPMNVYRLDGESHPHVTPPLMRQLPELPKHDPEEPDMSNEQQMSIMRKPLPTTTTVHDLPRNRTELPRLEIQIPSIQLDRYSVMFKNVSGVKPSSLLERRSRNLSNLKLANSAESDIPPVPAVKPQSIPSPPTTPRARVSYSLFPSQSQAANKTYQSPERKSLRSRSASRSETRRSEPVQALPVNEEPDVRYIEQHTPTQRKESESMSTSPDDTVVSSETDDAPWRSVDSLPSVPSSRTSMGSDLFFDLKPLRNSNGEEQADYVIHKPDTPEVQLAISRSHKAKKSQLSHQANVSEDFDVGPDLQAAEYMLRDEEGWRLSAQLNQAIAEIERLTSPSNSSPPLELASPEIFQPKLKPQELMPAIRLRKRLEGLAIGIPSPITERSETSPQTPSAQQTVQPTLPVQPNAHTQQLSHVATMSIKPVPLSTDSERLSEAFFEAPPPVPKKDKKFLPVSRYAVTSSSAKTSATEPQKIRRKPHRSATDSSIMITTPPQDVRQQNSSTERAASLPPTLKSSPQNQLSHQSPSTSSPTASSTTLSPRTHLSQSISDSIAKAMLVPSIAAPPTTEVSIARKVSLTRKQSHQILVSRTPTGRIDEIVKREPSDSVIDGATRRLSPEIKEVAIGHRPGRSVNVVVESAD